MKIGPVTAVRYLGGVNTFLTYVQQLISDFGEIPHKRSERNVHVPSRIS